MACIAREYSAATFCIHSRGGSLKTPGIAAAIHIISYQSQATDKTANDPWNVKESCGWQWKICLNPSSYWGGTCWVTVEMKAEKRSTPNHSSRFTRFRQQLPVSSVMDPSANLKHMPFTASSSNSPLLNSCFFSNLKGDPGWVDSGHWQFPGFSSSVVSNHF